MSVVQLAGGSGTVGKSGRAILGDFGGSPLVATVVFALAFPDASYAVLLEPVTTSGRAFAAHVENKTATGFEIHLTTSRVFGLSEVVWFATP